MDQFETRHGTHIIVKNADVVKYLTANQATLFRTMLDEINDKRIACNKGVHTYLLVNQDEPYYKEVRDCMQIGEIKKLAPDVDIEYVQVRGMYAAFLKGVCAHGITPVGAYHRLLDRLGKR